MNAKQALIVAFGVALAVCGWVNGGKAQSGGQPHAGPVASASQSGEKTAEQQFKNIQVLKGVPADQIFPTMQFIAASLGVECEFCHVSGELDKDDKKTKQTARKMMEMMIAINADNFDRRREVTCYSCHRGNAVPVAIPPVMADAKNGMIEPKKPEATAATTPTAEQLLDKYVQALGGAAAIEKITSRVMKGTIDVGAMSLPIEIYAKDPEKRISFTHTPDGDNITAFNGHEGWLVAPKRPAREMHGSDLDGAAIDADMHLATDFKQMFSEMKVEGPQKVGDHETYVLVGERAGKTPIRLYFDQQSGLLVRLVRFGETALGWLPTQIDFADYRDADGVKVPYRWTLARTSGVFTIQLSGLQQNVDVDDAKFAKPAPPAK